MDLDYLILTPTYNRAQYLMKILRHLAEEAGRRSYKCLHIIQDDCSQEGKEAYRQIRDGWQREFAPWYLIECSRWSQNHGKLRFWETLNRLYANVRLHNARYVVQIPDDGMPCKDFLTRTAEHFERLKQRDARVCAMNILCTLLMNWGSQRYLDNAMIADQRFFEAIGYQLHNCSAKHRVSPQSGSGTGMQVTHRILERSDVRVAPCQDVSYLRLMDTPSVMYPPEKLKTRPAVWWRENFVDS